VLKEVEYDEKRKRDVSCDDEIEKENYENFENGENCEILN
jgi:hypothetical protein